MARGWSVWKRTQNKKRKDQPWWVTYLGANGKRHVAQGYVDKESTIELARRLRRSAEREAEGLVDKFVEQDKTPIRQHLEDFIESLRSRERNDRYVSQVEARIVRIAREASVTRLHELDPSKVEQAINGLGLGGVTRNEYIASIKSFMAWCVANRRLAGNPLAGLKRIERKLISPEHTRRAFTMAELSRLLEASVRRPLLEQQMVRHGKNKGLPVARVRPAVMNRLLTVGKERRLAYLLGFWACLRRNEVRTLRWGSVEIDMLPARINLQRMDTKGRRAESVAIHPQLAEALRQMRPENVSPADRVLRTVPDMKAMKADLELAGVPYVDEQGRYADFHAMRTSLNTEMASRGIGQRIRQSHLRHTDPRLTEGAYTDVTLLPVAEEIGRMPAIVEVPAEGNPSEIPLRATGAIVAPVRRAIGAQLNCGPKELGGHIPA